MEQNTEYLQPGNGNLKLIDWPAGQPTEFPSWLNLVKNKTGQATRAGNHTVWYNPFTKSLFTWVQSFSRNLVFFFLEVASLIQMGKGKYTSYMLGVWKHK